jgi:hypothetical protein
VAQNEEGMNKCLHDAEVTRDVSLSSASSAQTMDYGHEDLKKISELWADLGVNG